MARTGPIHIFGVVLLFAAAICLLITTITSPVVNSLSILRVDLNNGSSLTYGTFGYCVLNTQNGGDMCTSRNIGYKAANEAAAAIGTGFSEASADTANGLTNVMVLHPIACGVAFLAFLISMGAGVIGSLVGFVVAAIAWIITLVVMATDFVGFAQIASAANKSSTSDNAVMAYYGSGMWTLVAAFVLLFIGMFVVLFTCCSRRRQRKRDRAVPVQPKTDYGTPAGRSRWYRFRRNRY